MSANSQYIDRIANRLYGQFQVKTEEAINRRVKNIQKELKVVQANFYTTLAAMTIGADGPPDLDGWTPTWRELSADYLKKKRRKNKEGFYNFSGKLKQSLLRSKATTTFGTPLIYVGEGGSYRNQRVYTNPKTGAGITAKGTPFALDKLKNLRYTLSVDLYPRVKENIRSLRIDEGNYFSDNIAMKMTNYKGARWRPILVHYMNWWLENRARDAVRKAIR